MIPLPRGPFDLIAADPPMRFNTYSDKGAKKSPQAYYSCMPLDAIKGLPLGYIAAPDAWLLLWTSAPSLDRAFEVMTAWGFEYKSRFAWRKMTKNNKPRMGPGFLVRTLHEDILLCSRGRPGYAQAFPSLFDGLARDHSRKPDEFFRLAELFMPNARRLDMFSRESRPGWTAWGDEAGKFDTEPRGLTAKFKIGHPEPPDDDDNDASDD
jgi:N6-adenosine-specific RNA methylase IME4